MKSPGFQFGMIPYQALFPQAREGAMTLDLPSKVGKVKAGLYHFVEMYCAEKGCDCRRLVLMVLDEKNKDVAFIEFGFDPDDDYAGPDLSPFSEQTARAKGLLAIFVDAINDNADWLEDMYRRYKQVRKQVEGHAYRGKPFPEPGAVVRFIKPAPEEDPLAVFEALLKTAERTPPLAGRRNKAARAVQGSLFDDKTPVAEGIAGWVERYRREADAPFETTNLRQTELRGYLYANDQAADELAGLLVGYEHAGDEACLDAGLQLLRDALEILRTDLERRRPAAARNMEQWQEALARHVFAEDVEPHLGAMVTQGLLDARVEILPLLHEANSVRMLAGLAADPEFTADPETALRELLDEMEAEGSASPHEFFEAVLQMMAVGDVEVQVNLCRLMLEVDHPIIREAAVLMLFHPQAEVRAGVAQTLAEVDGDRLTSASLRRLIVARNWFPEALRVRIDQAVTNARKARIECAPLPKRVEMVVHASAIDGAMAQTFQILAPEKKGFLCCSIMPKKGAGVADAFLIPLSGKRERNEYLAMLRRETGAVEVSVDYLHRRLCQALADGAANDKVPCHWLMAIAERLASDNWKAVPLDIDGELSELRSALERRGSRFLSTAYREQALEASAEWPDRHEFARSWFEDDIDVDNLYSKVMKSRRKNKDSFLIDRIFADILEPRRQQWLERLVLTTQWLRSAKKPPAPWEQMAHVAMVVADKSRHLEQIPLMETVADITCISCEGRIRR
ncbi:MAG: hypothetical protein RQ723_06090 [Desulfuromonadales bacterium]|nr:hypothetical protein [Desulfuromonadales bacterium]